MGLGGTGGRHHRGGVLRGPFGVTLGGPAGRPALGLWADPLTVVLLTLVCGVGALVQSFSLRYLPADREAPRFFAATNVVVGAMAIVCTAVSVPLLLAGWVTAGVGFVAVVDARPDLPGVRASARRTLRMFALGDLALVVAVAVIGVRVGNIDLVAPGALRDAAGHLGGLSSLVGLLIVIAALTRSAQGPLGRWLPGTVSAPTPASALLHAGVVNGGGILLVRLGALSGDSVLAMAAVFTVAGLTATVATAVMTRKPDVKGALVYSTIGQMGFMLAECSVGAYLAAVVHLVGHGLYKATLFFNSGSQVPRAGQAPVVTTPALTTWVRVVLTGIVAASGVAVVAATPGVLANRGSVVLLVFTAATLGAAGWAWWARRPAARLLTLGWAVALLAASALYGLVLATVGRWVGPALPLAGPGTLSPWWLLAVVGAGLVLAGLTRVPGTQRWLVARLIDIGAPPVAPPSGARRSAEQAVRSGSPGSVPPAPACWAGSTA